MFNIVDYEELVDDNSCIFVDVRSPKEFKEATIKGAINIPVLLDEEREEVGTVYVRENTEKAKKIGIEYISKRLPEIFEQVQELYSQKGKKIVFFCARGGMRSGTVYSLFYSLGYKVYKLKNGYKGYRKYINDNFIKLNEEVKYIVLYGKTGVGKTEYLKELRKRGYNVVDLEGAANHRGSILGGVALGGCRSQKAFETEVFEELKNKNSNIVFIEGESKRIGNIILPTFLSDAMQKGIKVCMDDTIENRRDLLVKEYTKDEKSVGDILRCLEYMSKYISKKRIEEYKTMVTEGNFDEVCEALMVEYYDPLYTNGFKEKEFYKELFCDDKEKTIKELIDIYNEFV